MGMLAGAIGGAANAVYDIYDKKIDQEARQSQRRDEMVFAQELDIRRQQTIEALKAKMAEAMAQRDATMRVESDEAGRDSMAKREFEKFKRDLGQTDMDEKQLREVFDQQYFDRSVAPGDANSQRYDPRDSDFTKASRTEAMKRGASSGLINAYTGQLKEDVANERYADQQERQARLDANRERYEEGKAERDERRVAATERTANAAVTRAERSGASGAKEDKLSETQKARLDILKRQVLDAEKAVGDAGSIKSRKDAAQARLDEANRKLDEFISSVESGGKTSTSKPPATENKPAATPPMSALQEGKQTRFANGQVWTLKNGKAVQVK